MSHAQAAARFLRDEAHADWHNQALWFIRGKRDRIAQTIPEWEQLRELAAGIKRHTLSRLDEYLELFETRARANGVQVHWAADAAGHNRLVLDILRRHGLNKMVKSKSMLTEECKLNPFLKANGVEVIDTDLGERIVQLQEEPPSHIVLPAIHKRKEEIGVLFHEKLGTPAGETDPQYLTEAARHHLRDHFRAARAALTGGNFAVAETGGVVVCTNEGNADMGVHLSSVQIHSVGIEKLIPRAADLGVFTRLLARSATGQPVTIYTAHHHRPRPGGEMHIILVDNGRSEHLGRADFWESLSCIRCGACMNTCPVYRRSGGHSYNYTVPGPIGSILTPGIDLKKFADLPFASTLCGSCSDVCPVKIDIHDQLYKWRQYVTQAGLLPPAKRRALDWAGWLLASPDRYERWGRRLRTLLRLLPRPLLYNRFNDWGRERELPAPPRQSFREWYRSREKRVEGRAPGENRKP